MTQPQPLPSDASKSSRRLMALVYEELRRQARRHMRKERAGHLLEPTALVHEAYLRIAADHENSWIGPEQFYRAAAEAMGRILVEEARKRARLRRGGDRQRVPLSGTDLAATDSPEEMLALDEILMRFAAVEPEAAEIARLRLHAGLDQKEIAGVLGLSERTVKRRWSHARAWIEAALVRAGARPPRP